MAVETTRTIWGVYCGHRISWRRAPHIKRDGPRGRENNGRRRKRKADPLESRSKT